MKYILILIAMFTHLTSCSQSKVDLIGTWQIAKIVNNSSSNIAGCMEAATEYKLTFYADNTYSFDAGPGYMITGSWKIEGNTISFFNCQLADPNQGVIADHAYPFEMDEDGLLIIDEYLCSESGGKTYYERV